MLSGGGGGVQSSFRPFFADKNGKARLVGAEYDDKASFIERTSVEDAFDCVDGGTLNGATQEATCDTPELRLVAAVIEDAARTLALPSSPRNDHLKRQAMNWVRGTIDSMPGFSFAACCAWLRLDEDYMREQMQRVAARNKGIGRRHHTVTRRSDQGRVAV